MLSSIVSTLSPKKLLAASISKSLAEFFHVDPEQVEANLVQDAKVTLKGIEIKPMRLGGLLVYGTVNLIEFSWIWDTGSFITDAKLTVNGVDIHVRLIHDDEQVCNPPTAPLQSSDQAVENDDNGKYSDWKSRYKQQIIDHLTCQVVDVSVSIHLENESRVVLETKDLELQTLQQMGDAREGTSALLQEISLGSIAAWIQDAGDTRYPILDPFGYHASVERISGRRFLDGVLSGLMIQGKCWTQIDKTHAPSAIRVYGGKQQLIGLNCLQRVLQSFGNGNDPCYKDQKVHNVIEPLIDGPEQSRLGVPGSIIRLPFQSIEIILEDDVKLRLEGCEVKYCMDGSELALHCVGGLWMDKFPILKNGAVIADFVDSRLELAAFPIQQENEVFYNAQSSILDDAPSNDDGGSTVQQSENHSVEFSFSIDLFQRLQSSIIAVLPEWQQAVALAEERSELHSQAQPPLSTSVPWTIVSKQSTSFRFEEYDKEWIRVTLQGLHMQQNQDRNGFPFNFSEASAELDCSSGLAITAPAMEMNNTSIAFPERVSVSSESADTINKLMAVWSDIFIGFGSQTPSSRQIMFDFTASGIDIAFADPSGGSIALDRLAGTGSSMKLAAFRICDVMGLSVGGRDLQLSTANGSQSLQIEEISFCAYEGSMVISSPIQEFECKYHQSSVSIYCDYLAMLLTSCNDRKKTTTTNEVPWKEMRQLEEYVKSLNFHAKKLHLSTDEGYELTAQDLNTRLEVDAQSTVLISVGIDHAGGVVEWKPMEALETSRMFFTLENSQLGLTQDLLGDCIRFNVKIGATSTKAEDGSVAIVSQSQFEGTVRSFSSDEVVLESLSIPLLGPLQSAEIFLSEIEAFHVPNFVSLESPCRSIEVKFSNNELVVSFQEVLLHRFHKENLEQNDNQVSSFDFPFKTSLSIASLSVEDLGLKQKVPLRKTRCTNMGVGFEPTLAKIGTRRESPGASVFFRCQLLEIKDSSSVFSVPGLSGSGLLQYEVPGTIGNLVVGLEKAQLEADFSSMEWSGAGQEPSNNLKLPFAAIPKFVLTLKCSGNLFQVEDAVIACGAFEGISGTTLDILKSHYVGVVKERIPYLLAKTSIAGANIGDSVGMMVGTLVTNTSVIGAAVGVASRDAVGSAVRQGKVARGVDGSEKYKFGDFTRGVVASVKGAAKSGAEMRNDEQYKFGDFTAGTTKAASSYASKNRMRLAGAGGSAAGMIAGAAILGPVGFVAGSFLGSSAAQSSVRSVVGDHSENEDAKTVDQIAGTHQSLDNRATSCSPPGVSSSDAPAPIALNAEARMVGGVSTSEQRVVMAQAQVVDLLSTEQPVAPIAPPATAAIRPSTQSTFSGSIATCTNENPGLSHVNNNGGNHSLVSNTPAPQHRSQYPIDPTPTTPVLAPPSSRARVHASLVTVGVHGCQTDGSATQQQQNMAGRAQSPSIRGVGVARQHPTSGTSNSTNRSQQQEGYRFGDVTRGIIARGRQLDGREENSGYKFGDFTRGLFG